MKNSLPRVVALRLVSLLAIAVFAVAGGGMAQQQRIAVRGQVVASATQRPIAGAAVAAKGSASGGVTDASGRFSFYVQTPPAVLTVTFLGFESREVPYVAGREFRIELTERAEDIGEVFVTTGYQTLDRRASTYSVASVSGEQVLQSNALTVDNMLQGHVAGMVVVNSTSTPGAAPTIRIRGTSTISGNREPLWVVDGVILEDPVSVSGEVLNNLDNVNLIGNAISGLNPMDIERIDVLKDASATALYGPRSSNGVIVVTTKMGKAGEPRVNYSGTFSLTARPSYGQLDRMNSLERIDVSREVERRGLQYRVAPAAVGYEGLLYDLYDRRIDYDQFLSSVQRFESNNTDWFAELFRTAVSHRHNVSISGGDRKTSYYFSGAYADEQANIRNSGVKQYNATMKLRTELSDKVTASINLRGFISDKEYLQKDLDAYSYAYNTSRAIPARNPDGSLVFYNESQGHNTPIGRNILNDIDNSGRTVSGNGINLVSNLEWRVIKGMRLTGTLGINSSHTSDKDWYGEKSYQAAKLRNLPHGMELPTAEAFRTEQCLLPYGGKLENRAERNFNYTARLQADYSRTFCNVHDISVAVGGEIYSNRYNGIQTTQWGYMPDRGEKFVEINPIDWPYYNTHMLLRYPDATTNRLTNTVSLYGIATYAYKSRYILNFNLRSDGSNKFGQERSARFLPVWSVSGRWNIYNESFLRDVMWLNEFSIKGSYGLQGNMPSDQTPRMVFKVGSMDPISGEYMNTLDKLPNPYLKWEKTVSYDLSVDFAVLDNRISGSVEYYDKKGIDQIVLIEVSPTTGVPTMSTNVGDVRNSGWEFMLNAVPVRTRDVTWSLNFNGGRNVNRVTRGGLEREFTWTDYINGGAVIPGRPINSFYSYRFGGLDAQGLPAFLGTEELDGMTREQLFANAFVYSGSRLPDIHGGFGTTLRYKNLSLTAFFAYSLGAKVRLNNLYNGQYLPSPQQNMSGEFVDRWREPGDERWAVVPGLSTSTLSMSDREIKFAQNGWQMYNDSDLRVASGDFLRLRTAMVRYSIPEKFCKRFGVAGGSVRVEGNNLWLMADKKLNGQDPEQLAMGSALGSTTTEFAPGSKLGGVAPPVSSFSLGIEINF